MTVDMGGYRKIDRSHHLRCHFDNGNLCAGMAEIFRHFQSDESSAHHDGAFHVVRVDKGLDAVGVFYVSEREDSFNADARKRRADGCRAGRKQKLVVALCVFFSVFVSDGHRFCLGVDAYDLVFHPYVDVETAGKRFGSLYEQIVAVGDCAADIVGQPAVGV